MKPICTGDEEMKNKWAQKNPAIVMLNHIGVLCNKVGIHPSLSEPSVMAAARRATGLYHFSDYEFMLPMRQLIADMEAEAQLTTFGRLFMRQRLVDSLAVLLQVDDIIQRHPEILAQKLTDIWFICALPRTGTTLLHRMLAADPQVRSVLTWEALYPVPPQLKPWQKDRRLQKVKLLEKVIRTLAPKIFAIHPIEHNSPEEDATIMQQVFLSQVAEGTMHVPNYAKWLEVADKTLAYQHLEKVLKILQWQAVKQAADQTQDQTQNQTQNQTQKETPARRWLMKNPFHMEDFTTLLKVFPQARIIQTHRNLVEAVPSVCSLSAHSRGFVSNHVDGKQVGQHWQKKYVHMVNRGMSAREHLNPEQFIDIHYDDLMKDPLGEIEKIYQKFNVSFSDETRVGMQRHGQENKKDKYGKHRYTLEEFGLTQESINKDFAHYAQHYRIGSQ